MKKFKIEKVLHSKIYPLHTCCVVDYYPTKDELIQLNFTDIEFAKSMKLNQSIGVWRVKPTDK